MFIAPLLLFQMNDLILKSNSVKWALLSHLNEETENKKKLPILFKTTWIAQDEITKLLRKYTCILKIRQLWELYFLIAVSKACV